MKSGHFSLEEMSFKCFVFYFWLLRPSCSAKLNGLDNFGRRLHKEHFCEIISKSVQQFWRRRRLKQKLTTHGRTDDGQNPITIAHLEHLKHIKERNDQECRLLGFRLAVYNLINLLFTVAESIRRQQK